MNLVEIKKLSFNYPDKEDTLKNINLKIKKGEFICIVGENGSGKSTLIKCMVGLNNTYKGEINLKEKVGYLPQKTEIQSNFPASIEEVILSGTISNGLEKIWYSKEDKENATRVMKELELYDIRKRCFRDLSGGQQQRVLIARALCSTKNMIILDEPTNGLDPSIARQIYKILHKLNKDKSITVIMVSHDIDRAIKFCSRVIELKDGKVTFDGETSSYDMEGGTKW